MYYTLDIVTPDRVEKSGEVDTVHIAVVPAENIQLRFAKINDVIYGYSYVCTITNIGEIIPKKIALIGSLAVGEDEEISDTELFSNFTSHILSRLKSLDSGWTRMPITPSSEWINSLIHGDDR